jgi:hypothetical protein
MGPLGLLGALGIVALLANGGANLAPSGGIEGTFHSGPPEASPTLSSACEGILGEWNINSSAFLQVCSEPSFQSAYDQRGEQEFFTGGSSGPGFSTGYYGFEWTGACHNSSWAGGQCSEQEYWAVNQSSGAISGPFYQEGPPVCAGCPPGSYQAPVFLFIGGAIATVVITAVILSIG